ncbi:MAG: glycosyltransferase family 2 protein [Patescibacteria group bacterium]
MKFPKVTIQLVTWNSLRYLPECLKSIFDQSYRDFQVLIIDNNSQDATIDWLKLNYPQVAIFQNKKNVGFSRANNQGIKLLNSPYVVLCNPDIILSTDWLGKIMASVESDSDKQYGVFGGKLLKLKIVNWEISELEKTKIIDSCGLRVLKNHRVLELGAGEAEEGWNKQQEVFGFSGALALYRREALETCLIKTKSNPQGEYFDEDFFCYKEDVDLSWRLQLLGWRAWLNPQAVAYHLRSLGGSEKIGFRQIFGNRRRQSTFSRYYSYRNHLLVLLKNEFLINLIKYGPRIFWYEFKKFCYLLLFEWSSLSAAGEAIRLLPKIFSKRKLIFKKTRVEAGYLRKWFN